MQASRRLLYVAYMCHQAIEKTLKCAYTAQCQAIAPKMHALVALALKSGLYNEMTNSQQDFLEVLEPMSIECRYPAEKEKLLAELTISSCERIISATEEMMLWIKRKLSRE